MSQVVKSFMGMFFILMILLLGAGILSAQVNVANAQDYKADVIAELENSNYSPNVLNGCIRQAVENGYSIKIKTYAPGKTTASYTTPSVVDTSGVVMAEVKLSYPYRIGFLNSETWHQIRGYAR